MRQPLLERRVVRSLIFIIVVYQVVTITAWLSAQDHKLSSSSEHHVQLLRVDSAHNQIDTAEAAFNSDSGMNTSLDLDEFNTLSSESFQDLDSTASDVTTLFEGTSSAAQLDLDNNANTSSIPIDSPVDAFFHNFLANNGSATPQLKCLGWQQTGGCSPDGPRETERDASCSTNIKAGASGYCLLRNGTTGQEVRVMQASCSSLRSEVEFNCDQAADFALVTSQLKTLVDASKTEQLKPLTSAKQELTEANGVLMVMYPKLLLSVYATIRVLRSYNCSLPVELWFLENEMGANPLGDNQLLESLVNEYGPISLRGISSDSVDGFNTKVYALANSGLDQVLFLDTDNTPVKDPTYLFTTQEFIQTGAIFWPDFWQPTSAFFAP
ncbi:hypothetical protein ON010_g8960 [Phytophthora cinnamomi]|nr:hypothetical protein ON010_g8960 [Phytophthora cinnamomi]